MEIFLRLIQTIADDTPDWLPLIFLPAVLAAVAVLLTLLGGRKLYLPLAVVLGAIGFLLVACKASLTAALLYAGLFAALAALLRLLFFFPCLHEARKKERRYSSREEKIYRKFREPLTEAVPPAEKLPPKVCCYESAPAPSATAEESGMQLLHVRELIQKLQAEELSPSDRLETDVISRRIDALHEKELTQDELSTLNDCLASVLKLTAKYKL